MREYIGNIFANRDQVIVRAFIERESLQYRWVGEENRLAWVDKIVDELMSHREAKPGFNFARIQSLTNMGQLQDELVLSTQHLDTVRGDIKFFLPPSPRGGIGVHKDA